MSGYWREPRGSSRVTTARAGALCAAALAWALSGAQAWAAPRYNKSEVSVEAAPRKVTSTGPVAGPAANMPTGPELAAERFRQATNAQMAQLTDAAIATMQRLIRVTGDDDPEKPDFYFRLAEHYREKKVDSMLRARELDEKIYQASSREEKSRLKDLQRRYDQAEKQWMLGAIKLYLRLANTPAYAGYARMDQVLYSLADMLTQAGHRDQARAFFGKLIRNYPQSKYIPDAYLSFAEYYFNVEKDPEKALRLYERVAKYPESPVYGYALYKQGWAWINLKDPKKAMDMFVRVIRESDRFQGSKKGRVILVREAKKDLVKAYAMIGSVEQAWPFFRRVGGSYAPEMLERLGMIYYDQGKFIESIQVYKELISLNPQSPELCNWQYNVVRASLSGRGKRDQVVEARRLAAIYDVSKKRGGLDSKKLARCEENASGVLRELATTWHREAQKTQNPDTYALAQYLYREYLDSFPNAKDAYRLSFYYAELLFKLERWAEAADAYTRVVKMQPKGPYLKTAAYAAVISWKNALNVEQELKDTAKTETAKQLAPQPIPEKQQKMIAAFDTYLKYVPQAEERVQIMYRKARIYYENNHFAKAADLFGEIVNKYPSSELAPYSANLLLDSLNALKRYEEIEVWVDRLLKIPHLAQGEFLTTLRDLRRGIQRKKLEEYQKTGRYRECGEGYAQLANDYPDDARWPELAYNAALCYEAAKLIGQAIAIRQKLIEVKPNDPLAQKALYMTGANYHALAWYSRAADNYERFAQQFPGEKEAPEALQNAIVFRLGQAEYGKAGEDAELYAKNYGKRPQFAASAAKVIFTLGTVYEQKRDREGLVKHYTSYLRTWGRQGGPDRQIQAHMKMAEALWKESCPVEGINGACIKIERVRAQRKLGTQGKKHGQIRKQCGPETKNKITVVKRTPNKAAQAMAHVSEALALGRHGLGRLAGDAEDKSGDDRKQKAQYALAEARFFQAEKVFETMLSVEFPDRLDFSDRNKEKKKDSMRRFNQYLKEKSKLLEQARTSYQDVIKLKVEHWAIAAAARIGQLYQDFADALYTAPVPTPQVPNFVHGREARDEFYSAFTDAYCDALEDKARPLETKAVEGLAACMSKSTELSWFNEWSKLCESELNQIQPAEYPIASEIRAEPGYLSMPPDRAGLVKELN